MIDNKDVMHIASLARLKITDEEREQFKVQLSNILDYFQKLDELDTGHIEPMKHVIETQNVLRADEPRPHVSQAEALKNAPQQDGQHFIVPGVFED